MTNDPINPAHYGKIQGLALEPLIMEAPYFLGAAIKYVWRCKKKGGAEDIRKARRCLELHIEGNPEPPHGAVKAANAFLDKARRAPRTLQITAIMRLLVFGYQLDEPHRLPAVLDTLDTLEKALERGAY